MSGLEMRADHMYRWEGGPLVPGVTTVIKTLDKSGPLIGWAKRVVAQGAIHRLPELVGKVIAEGPYPAEKWLKGLPDEESDEAKDLGSRVHSYAEAIVKGDEPLMDDIARPYVEAYRRDILERLAPRFLQVEYRVYSERHLYAGTADIAWELDGEVWLCDIKTGRGIWPETGLQLAGLHNADFLGREGDPTKYAIPPATRFGVIHVRPDGATLVPYNVTDAEWRAFLACRELWTWQQERAKNIKEAA